MTHRKHVHGWETGPVAEALRDRLTETVPFFSAEQPLTPNEQALFRVLYRFETNREGRPDYPGPPTWGTVAEYLRVTVPGSVEAALKASKMDPFPQTETPPAEKMDPFSGPTTGDMDPFPETCPKCGKPLVNPNYCISCGANLRLPTLEVSA